jgi:F-type H+-transporting ATPase subunit b
MALTVILASGTIILAGNTTTDTHTAAAAGTTTDGQAATAAAATTAEVGHADAGHGAKKTFPPLDPATFMPQLIWFGLTFGVFYWLLAKVALPKVSSVIQARADHIKRDLDEAGRLKTETDKALADYEKALADAKGKANGIAQQTRDTLKTYTDQQRTHVDKQIAEKTASAEQQISAAKTAAMGNVGAIAAETAEAIIGKLIGQAVGRDEIAAAVKAIRG